LPQKGIFDGGNENILILQDRPVLESDILRMKIELEKRPIEKKEAIYTNQFPHAHRLNFLIMRDVVSPHGGGKLINYG
jgi:hypothetical protein